MEAVWEVIPWCTEMGCKAKLHRVSEMRHFLWALETFILDALQQTQLIFQILSGGDVLQKVGASPCLIESLTLIEHL